MLQVLNILLSSKLPMLNTVIPGLERPGAPSLKNPPAALPELPGSVRCPQTGSAVLSGPSGWIYILQMAPGLRLQAAAWSLGCHWEGAQPFFFDSKSYPAGPCGLAGSDSWNGWRWTAGPNGRTHGSFVAWCQCPPGNQERDVINLMYQCPECQANDNIPQSTTKTHKQPQRTKKYYEMYC